MKNYILLFWIWFVSCFQNTIEPTPIETIVNTISFSSFQKHIFITRIIPILQEYMNNLRYMKRLYFCSRISLQISSLLIPALLGLQTDLFWLIWSLSLFVGIITNFIQMFRWDKKYYLLQRTHNMLITECWHFLEQIGSIQSEREIEKRFLLFCNLFEEHHQDYLQNDNNMLKKATNLSPTPYPKRNMMLEDPLDIPNNLRPIIINTE